MIKEAGRLQEEEYFYRIRAVNPRTLDPVERASRFIYLNKTRYNGLYRENSKGEFNVPFGRYKAPKIVDERNILAVSEFLRSVELHIMNTDYREVCELAQAGDFIYLDPPYQPVSRTSSFTKYNRLDFGERTDRACRGFQRTGQKGMLPYAL